MTKTISSLSVIRYPCEIQISIGVVHVVVEVVIKWRKEETHFAGVVINGLFSRLCNFNVWIVSVSINRLVRGGFRIRLLGMLRGFGGLWIWRTEPFGKADVVYNGVYLRQDVSIANLTVLRSSRVFE